MDRRSNTSDGLGDNQKNPEKLDASRQRPSLDAPFFGLLVCTKCKVSKDADHFHRNAGKVSGRDSQCKSCVSSAKAAAHRVRKVEERKTTPGKRRRRKCKVINVDCLKFEDFLCEAHSEKVEDIVRDFVERVSCKRTVRKLKAVQG